MRRTTPRTTLGSCSTRTAAPMRRNVSSSLKHTQQHNGTLVPARVPFSCLFGQVASMRNQQAQKSTAHFQTQRANARHRPTFPHTHELTHNPVHRRIQVRSSLVRCSPLQDKRVALSVQMSPTKQLRAIPRAVNQLRNQLTYVVLVTRVHTS